ncbi:MAG: hypothetical protein JWM47_1092 [Acidimicrobiales bacterium]|nr:hypothetical protein [Acidimicrobiales bacterium]
MSDPINDEVSESTRSTEADDELIQSGPDRQPTPEEEEAAERAPDLDPSVAEAYEHQAEVGANIEGEGKVG